MGCNMWPPFHASIASLTLAMATITSTITLLTTMGILAMEGFCSTCHGPTGPYKTRDHYNYFFCSFCRAKTSILYNSVLYNSNTKHREFVLIMYQFCQKHRSYETVRRETFLPQEGYKVTKLSSQTINKWFSYFRYLCVKDIQDRPPVIGEPGDVVEMDETLCGKRKYNKGQGSCYRSRWLFGGVSRQSGRCFMRLCPENKRTKKALWPIVQAHVVPGTTLYTDGWRAYRRFPELGYPHRWINHNLYYVHPDDRTLHTNTVEGLWRKFKSWLPQAGRYNLDEYVWLFLWIEERKHDGEDPFWALVKLVAADNSLETLSAAVEKDMEEKDTEATEYDAVEDAALQKEASDEEEEEEEEEEEDKEVFYWFDCIFCKSIFLEEKDLLRHLSHFHSI